MELQSRVSEPTAKLSVFQFVCAEMLWHLFTQNKPLDCPIMPGIMASALMPVLTRLNMSLVTVTVVLGVL